jgi:hypothetical protein
VEVDHNEPKMAEMLSLMLNKRMRLLAYNACKSSRGADLMHEDLKRSVVLFMKRTTKTGERRFVF